MFIDILIGIGLAFLISRIFESKNKIIKSVIILVVGITLYVICNEFLNFKVETESMSRIMGSAIAIICFTKNKEANSKKEIKDIDKIKKIEKAEEDEDYF